MSVVLKDLVVLVNLLFVNCFWLVVKGFLFFVFCVSDVMLSCFNVIVKVSVIV